MNIKKKGQNKIVYRYVDVFGLRPRLVIVQKGVVWSVLVAHALCFLMLEMNGLLEPRLQHLEPALTTGFGPRPDVHGLGAGEVFYQIVGDTRGAPPFPLRLPEDDHPVCG